jgi:hypothetical protein
MQTFVGKLVKGFLVREFRVTWAQFGNFKQHWQIESRIKTYKK